MSTHYVGWADDGTHPLSQANMKTLDLSARDGVRQIGSGSASNIVGFQSVTIASGLAQNYRSISCFLSGSFDTEANWVELRINGIAGSDYRSGVIVNRVSDGAVTDTTHLAAASRFRVAQWGTGPGEAVVDFHHANAALVRVSSQGTRTAEDSAVHRLSQGGGRHLSADGIDSIEVVVFAGITMASLVWTVTGVPA